MPKSYTTPLCSCILCKREFTRNSSLVTHSCYADHHKENGQKGGNKTKIISYKIQYSKWKSYYSHPTICSCGKEKDWFRKNNKYCSSSCAASNSNKNRKDYGYKESHETKLKRSLSTTRSNKERAAKKLKFSKVSFCIVCGVCIPNEHKKTCSKLCYSKNLSNKAKANPLLGGNKNNRAYGWYDSPIAGRVWLESSYEYKVAVELDNHHIIWNRPKGLKYILENKQRTYLPDFYLVEYNVYLDPKNEYLIIQDQQKIECVKEQNNINVIILNKTQLTWKSILNELETGFEPARA